MRWGFLLGWIVLGLSPGPIEAQDERQPVEGTLGSSYLLRTWSRASGMPHGTVTAIDQGPDGYLWLGTFDGLARFDGWRFRSYGLSEGLASNRITALLVDSRGGLWIGHEVEGLSRLSDDRIVTYGVADGLSAGTFWTIYEDDEGTLYFGTERGLMSRRPGQDAFRREGRFDKPIHSVLVDRAGDLWVAGRHGLSRRPAGTESFVSIVSPLGEVFSLVEDQVGAIWAGTEYGLWRGGTAAEGEWAWQGVVEANCPVELSSSIASIAFSESEGLWFRPCTNAQLASDTRLYRLPLDSLGSVEPTVETIELHSVPATTALLATEDGGLWLGTYGRGIGALIPQRVRRWTLGEAFQVQELRAMVGDGGGGLWISANCGAPLIRFEDGRFEEGPVRGEGIEPFCIGGLARGRDGGLWLGAGGDLVRIRTDGSIVRRTLGESDQEIYSILEGRDGEVWAGLAGLGLARLDGDGPDDIDIGDDRVRYFTRRDGLASDFVHSLAQDRNGDVWIGTHQGLSHYRDGSIRSYTEADGMAPGMVRVIYEDDRGVLWIGTYGGGLSRYERGRFTRFTSDVGLYENVVTHLLEDRFGRFWMLGNRGLYYHPREQLDAFAAGEIDKLTAVFFDEADGMIEGSGGRQPSGWKMDDGRLFFPTVDGLVMMDSERIDQEQRAPAVLIDEVFVEGRRLNKLRSVELAPGERDLEIHYTSPGQFNAEKTRFRFRLVGYDEQWTEVGDRRTAYFTGLRPGQYTFLVSAANRYGVWSERNAALELWVQAPWWRTRAAFVLYALVAAALLFVYAHRQKRRIEQGEALLEQRTRQLQELAGLLPICANCKKVRDDEGLWAQMEVFFSEHSNLRFSHGICPDCAREVMQGLDESTASSRRPARRQ